MRKTAVLLAAVLMFSCSKAPEPPPPAGDQVIWGPGGRANAPPPAPDAKAGPKPAPAVQVPERPPGPRESLNAPVEYIDVVLHGLDSRERLKRDRVQEAVEAYKALKDRLPKDVEEMKQEHLVIPKLPEEMYYKIDAEGKVYIIKRVPKSLSD